MKFRKIWKRVVRTIKFQNSSAKSIKKFIQMLTPNTSNHALVRIGGETDGGYLIPNDLKGVKTCFSPGVSNICDFELDMANRGIRSFMADFSVDGPASQNPLFSFEKKFLGVVNNEVYSTLEAWVDRNASDESDMVLQMDIENSEYEVLGITPRKTLAKFRMVTIEFHSLDSIRTRRKLKYISSLFKKLLQDFEVVHIHPNNVAPIVKIKGFDIPPILEFTFLRKDRITTLKPTTSFPHPLDRINVNNLADVVLPKCWYQS